MAGRNPRVCPVQLAGRLDSRIRRWLQDPRRILSPYVREGMTALDLGCGPGFFSLDMAALVGESGRVIACDLQDGMLARIRAKIEGTNLEDRIILHKCGPTTLGVPATADFALAFYMVHEVPDKQAFFSETFDALKPGGRLLVVEPPFHVSARAFESTLQTACAAGFRLAARPGVRFSSAALLQKD